MLKTKKIGLFIDSENMPHNAIKQIIDKIQLLGNLNIKKAYGDFKVPGFSEKWNKASSDYELKLIQSNRSSSGKSSTDMAMAIDIMDTLHKNSVDVYCITSGDSDFLPLVNRIKNAGKTVIVCAVEGQTNRAMMTGSHLSFYIELKSEKEKSETKKTSVLPEKNNHPISIPVQIYTDNKFPLTTIKEKIEVIIESKKDKISNNKLDMTFISGTFGNRYPGLKYKEYGCKNFSSLMSLLKYKTLMENDKIYIVF